MESSIMKEIIIIFIVSSAAIYTCSKFGVPSIIGFIISGVAIGPGGFKLISDSHTITTLAELGVIVLLFVVGLEFSLKSLKNYKKIILYSSTLQFIMFIPITYLISKYIFALSNAASIVLSMVMSLSSTAIALNIMQKNGDNTSPYGRIATGVLIFQDFAVVIMIMFLPIIGSGSIETVSIIKMLVKGAVVIAVIFVLSQFIVPRILTEIAKVRNSELFVLSIVSICFGVAYITEKGGLSLAIGAFVAGLALAESEHAHHSIGNILPFKETFMSFFFVSVGSMVDVKFLISNILPIMSISLIMIGMKVLVNYLSFRIVRAKNSLAIKSSVYLSQIGEFAFIIISFGLKHSYLDQNLFQYLISSVVITMVLSPYIIKYGFFMDKKLVRKISNKDVGIAEKETHLSNHIIIIGYGLNGRNLVKCCKKFSIPYIIIEYNIETVLAEKAKGENIIFGDASQDVILKHADIENAKTAVIAVSDQLASKRIAAKVKHMNNEIKLIVRARYFSEIYEFKNLGVDATISEEYETSLEILSKVLTFYNVSGIEIKHFVDSLRGDHYQLFGSESYYDEVCVSIRDHDFSVISAAKLSFLHNKSISESLLRSNYGINIVAIRKGIDVFPNPDPSIVIEKDDELILFGHIEALKSIRSQ